jgi:hypothetical protein
MISSRALLMLTPKCPVCVAAYVAVATGFGFSISTAAHLRMLLIVLCAVSLVFVATKHLRRFVTQKSKLTANLLECRS